jgi:hypothetical protein
MTPKDFHPATGIFPLLPSDELKALAEDIRAHGMREPIVLHPNGHILDGRNRAVAWAMIEHEAAPPYRTWTGAEGAELAFVVSMNLRRRHLDVKERAFIAAGLTTTSASPGRPGNLPQGTFPVSVGDAATLLDVSPHSVSRARVILAGADPVTLESIRHGPMGLSEAARMTRTHKTKARKPSGKRIDRSRAARAERVERLRAMAKRGFSSRQMAASIGTTDEWCRNTMRKTGIVCPADEVLRGRRRLEANRFLEGIVFAATHLTADVDQMDLAEIDPRRLRPWINQLIDAQKSLGNFVKHLQREQRRRDDHGKNVRAEIA